MTASSGNMTPDADLTGAPHDAHAAATTCANCGETLQGGFCHACGQSRHDPTRNVLHAIEDVFESIWHLDGRIFRTLRDLLVPGRVAIDYLSGHRVRYVAPLRLFVVLSVLTFFVANLGIEIEDGTGLAIQVGEESDFSRATTVQGVERLRDAAIAELERAEGEARARSPATATATQAAVAAVRTAAARRVAELERPRADGPPRPTIPPTGAASTNKAPTIQVDVLPATANTWLNDQVERLRQNALRIRDDPDAFVHSVVSAVPSALVLLVPVFAVLLKLAYLLKRRLYLEHLVVALYSHAFLLLSLLALFLLIAAREALAPGAGTLRGMLGLAQVLVGAWMPLYLLMMQKRVYAQGWPVTLLKFFVIGTLYFVLLAFGAAFLVTYMLARI